ncbi:MAG: hypothetical protein H7177_17090 [Rhizobacter sp.]|nr:hypothetical protein [Bacteriovorax sp.]
MKYFKNFMILALGSTFTFYALDYTLGDKLRHQKKFDEYDEEIISADATPSVKQFNKNIIAMQAPRGKAAVVTDFYSNTFQPTPDAKGLPQLKHGKRWYNEAKMEALATSANLEEISRDDE